LFTDFGPDWSDLDFVRDCIGGCNVLYNVAFCTLGRCKRRVLLGLCNLCSVGLWMAFMKMSGRRIYMGVLGAAFVVISIWQMVSQSTEFLITHVSCAIFCTIFFLYQE
jgi:uncharacterized membrane protein YiaA